MPRWTADDIPDQAGRVAVVTGANSGLGFQTALALARKRARVVMACCDQRKAAAALALIRERAPGAAVEVLPLDLASLEAIRRFADAFAVRFERLDLLLDNAGVMVIPRDETADGFERQLGVNVLGHFALTGLLLDRLLATSRSRVVATTSLAHLWGRVRFDDLHGRRSYTAWSAYAQSKLANLLFAFELQRRLAAAGAGTISLAAHPGWATTGAPDAPNVTARGWYARLSRGVALSAAMGALPQLYAATSPDARGGACYGPALWIRGHPERAYVSRRARDAAAARRLWAVAEQLTGVRYAALEVRVAAV
jgi:NAD(P)-dependent dehydrogenase (short-subunit alcohol dehydrogenase family)